MVLTANSAVSWSVPTLTHPVLAGQVVDVVDPVRVRLAQGRVDEVVDLDPLGVPGGPPLAAVVLVWPDQFLLLGVHADHRLARVAVFGGLVVEIGELHVAIRMLVALDRLGVGLQAEPLLAQQLRHRLGAYPVPGRGQLGGELPGRYRGPRQRRLRIPAPGRLHQPQQRRQQALVGLGGRLPAATGTADPAQRGLTGLQLRDPVADPGPRGPRRPGHCGDSTMTQRPGLTGQHQPLPPLVQVRQHRLELRPQRRNDILTDGHTPLSDSELQTKPLFTDAP
jgi:hypothetical protein